MNFLDTAVHCVEETKDIFKRGFLREKEISYKGTVDLVTSVDKEIEDKVIKIIQQRHPDHDILSEESDGIDQASSYRWIVDPLDGTTNFAHNVPHFALSIALEYKKEIIMGLVYNPMSEELFTAEKGKGAYLNQRKISVSKIKDISQSLLGTGFPYDRHENADLYLTELRKFMVKAQGLRRPGVASLDLCYVACGRFDGFWERKLSPWDVAAGIIIIEEAGGQISNFSGAAYKLSDDNIIASNKLIHNDMVSILSNP